MSSLKVSVVVCTYQREETLRLTLGDILGQEFASYEVILVDQTPRHEPATDEFLRANAARIRLIHLASANLPAARNRGIEAARGEVVVFIDDDVRLGPDVLARIFGHFNDGNVGAIAPIVVDDRGVDAALADYSSRYSVAIDKLSRPRFPAREAIGACMAIRRTAVIGLGGFDANLGLLHRSASGEDYEFFQRAVAGGCKLWIDPKIEVLHLGSTPGGCGVRASDPADARRAQLQAWVYIVRKGHVRDGRSWLWTWAKLIRSCLLRRDVLLSGVGVRKRVGELLEAVRIAGPFINANSDLPRFASPAVSRSGKCSV